METVCLLSSGWLPFKQVNIDSLAFSSWSCQLDEDLTCVEIAVKEVGIDCDVLDMCLRTGIEIHLAGYTCEAPEILVFQIRAVTPAHHLHGNQVLALLQIFGNIELGSHLRIL